MKGRTEPATQDPTARAVTGRRRWLVALGLAICAMAVVGWLHGERETIPLRGADTSEMVFVAGGEFRVRSEEGSLRGRLLRLEPYFIDRFEVTEREWKRFLAASGRESSGARPEVGSNPDYPARFIRYPDAVAFARWKHKELPTNWQWERASQGPEGKRFPWGDGFLMAANTKEVRDRRSSDDPSVTRVGTFERGRSAVGAYDMIGNVWEWTCSPGTDNLYGSERFSSIDWRELDSTRYRIIRGGAFDTPISRTTPKLEDLLWVMSERWDLGMRCSLSLDLYRRQTAIIDAVGDLGHRWRLLHWSRIGRAERTLENEVPALVLPILEEARGLAKEPWLIDRLDDVMTRIRAQS
ncbi:MAG: SUMF1/EgtB/PvdO family nonheme iron enzyme [Planctomycetes bacterium]|nr:SUMF1/EgtB/PvdO family nonheme iron enzyme [Planctomycetota bacterium]